MWALTHRKTILCYEDSHNPILPASNTWTIIFTNLVRNILWIVCFYYSKLQSKKHYKTSDTPENKWNVPQFMYMGCITLTSNHWHLPGPIFLLSLSNEVATCYFGKGLKKVEIQFLNIPFCPNFACFILNFTGNYTPTKVSHLKCPWKYLSSPSDAYYTGQPTQFETKPIKRGWLHSAAFPIKLLVLWKSDSEDWEWINFQQSKWA